MRIAHHSLHATLQSDVRIRLKQSRLINWNAKPVCGFKDLSDINDVVKYGLLWTIVEIPELIFERIPSLSISNDLYFKLNN